MRLTASLSPLLLLSALAAPAAAQPPDDLKSRAERTNFEETSRYDDVAQFFAELAKRSNLVRNDFFGTTQEGRKMPLVVIANPPISTPAEAKASGKLIYFVMANIHAGEVEGKEAVQHIARRLTLGDLRPLLEKLVIVIAPIYNADGNEKFSLTNRTTQNGPIGGVGVRPNSQSFDLNRDYMKLFSPEAKALVRLLNQWDPHMTVDLHTTNGSTIAYHLTYSHPLNPMVDPRILAYHRETMMPVIAKAMLDQHQFRTYYYGNISGQGENRAWRAFTHEPRIGQNYVGFRNRLTILSEAYSYASFKRRVEVTEAFVEEIGKFLAARGPEIDKMTKQADADAVKRGQAAQPFQFGVEYAMTPLPQPVEILVGETQPLPNPRNNRNMRAMVEDKVTPTKMLDYGLFVATRTVPAAHAYLVRPDAGKDVVREKLRQHGIAMEELTEPLTAEAEGFVIDSVTKRTIQSQGTEVRIKGKPQKQSESFPAGTLVVRTAQPMGMLAAYLMEPESDDGLSLWGFFGDLVAEGKTHPVYKLMSATRFATKVVD